MIGFGKGKVFLLTKIIETSLKKLNFIMGQGDGFGSICTEGIYDDDFIGKPEAFHKVGKDFSFIQGNRNSANFWVVFLAEIVVCVKVIILPRLNPQSHVSKLPVLMYHKVSSTAAHGLTVRVDRLEAQFAYLKQAGYTSTHSKDVASLPTKSGKRYVQITFDDGYLSQLELAYPLLQKYQLKATFFIPLKYVDGSDSWNQHPEPIMSWEQLGSLDPAIVELGYHSYAHQKYTDLDAAHWEEDMEMALQTAAGCGLSFTESLAYPYGKFPRKDPERKSFFSHLQRHNMQLGYRIGNRINRLPLRHPFEIQRIDVKGEYSLATFRRKLRWGKRAW